MKRLIRILAVSAVVVTALTSCLKNEGNSYAGFSTIVSSGTAYANTTRGYLQFMSYGDWRMTVRSGSDWLRPDTLKGMGMAIYTIPVRYSVNTTGASRVASLYLEDIATTDANVSFQMGQYATRGDGSLGTAPLVKTITGDDDSKITIDYDEASRPTKLTMVKGDSTYRKMFFNWGDTLLTVSNNGRALTGKIGVAYQPQQLTSGLDTVGYFMRGSLVGANDVAFNVEEHINNSSEYSAQALLFENQKSDMNNPDGDFKVDSLRYLHHYANGTQLKEFLRLSYGEQSNKYQSVDANQLLMGIEECNPYLLVGLFRQARSGKLVTEAKASDGSYVVTATLNSDKSVNTLTVKDKKGDKRVYTFGY